jgi:peptide/nickel transport system permease protein
MSRIFVELRRYPSALAGLAIIGLLVVMSIYAVVAIPYSQATRLWRGGEQLSPQNPRNAWPVWINLFPGVDAPRTLAVSSLGTPRHERDVGAGVQQFAITLPVEVSSRGFPQELSVFFDVTSAERQPHVSLAWRRPDGSEIPLAELTVRSNDVYRISSDQRLRQQLGGPPEVVLFANPNAPQQTLRGTHTLVIRGFLFDAGSRLDARLVVYGQVYGLAGTDHQRRDLMIALLWGTPIAMAFGLVAAVGSSVSTLVIAAIGVWYGRWVDGLIQRITEVNLILPGLPILIMVATLYSRNIWLILALVIVLGVFGGIKGNRALFLQVKEAPYIEAARAYGAGSLRVILHYMLPRVIPVLVPSLVTVIPSFVFLEATLAVLGLGDPSIPTWGKVLDDAYRSGALFVGQYYWVLEPAVLLMLSGLGFTMLGFALDRVVNPRLRETS